MDMLEETKVCPPGPDKCPICATKHDPREPHARDSLYYQNRFRRRHKRFPTWADALAHCSSVTKAAWKDKLLKAGVSPEELGEDGSSRVD